ncbi:peptide/nickel transport system substrate-binding protein [Streptomyces sp. SLBN-118]|uniref:ABC transporter family substrate-binding protein n=1 Tax=Streptomyces sp. SLBN-118 TaxID=2768454 RepID=UPI0011513481|nr:ABC transporter family substrate-binding protein [Streptomyces sp. SLBN-118]TQK52112.1 peptide/nickel transport system substrate-binding protein [Streptomyces sp. SLBN-118]
MPEVDAPRGRTCSRTLRSVALLTSGVLALPVLSGCGSGDTDSDARAAAQDIAPAGRDLIADGGTLRWAIDAMPTTLNTFQADADAATSRIAGAVLPALFTLDRSGRPQRNPDFVESAKIVKLEPKQVVLYKLNQQAVWSDGREIGAPDFVSQWRALSGKNSAFWTARNAGYERIEKIERGANDLEVKITFKKPYADWQSLFTPLYPKEVTGSPASFNDGARTALRTTAGPFLLKGLDPAAGKATLVRNPRWWGSRAKLKQLVLTAVPRDKRAAALAAGSIDLAEIDRATADRITLARKNGAAGQQLGREAGAAVSEYATEQKALRGYVVRKSLEPAYTQLALNGESGPLADDRVRRAVARALDRKELAEAVLSPLGLPAAPLGSHLALAGQRAYKDNSRALGDQDTEEARALLADAGWTPAGARMKPAPAKAGGEDGTDTKKPPATASPGKASPKAGPNRASDQAPKEAVKEAAREKAEEDVASNEGLYIVGDDKPASAGQGPESGSAGTRVLAPAPAAAEGLAVQRRAESRDDDAAGQKTDAQERKGTVAGAYAPRGSAAPVRAGTTVGKNGKPLNLRFVLPSGPGSEALRTVGDKIAQMLDRIGVHAEITKVPDDSYFKDHIASGDYDLALYSWPATAYPATDARPIYAKPEPATDGSLLVEQNYTRVGSDYINQLFDQAASELDEDAARDLVRKADARIWAAAGSIPLYQRPELVAARRLVANAGAFGFAAPRYQDIGFKKPTAGAPKNKKK